MSKTKFWEKMLLKNEYIEESMRNYNIWLAESNLYLVFQQLINFNL